MTAYDAMFWFGLLPFAGFVTLFFYSDSNKEAILHCSLVGVWCLVYVFALQILTYPGCFGHLVHSW